MSVTKIVNMHQAKTQLSKLVEEVERGEDVILARAGKPVARIVAIGDTLHRRLGQWRDKVRMSKDFDAPLTSDLLVGWEGGQE